MELRPRHRVSGPRVSSQVTSEGKRVVDESVEHVGRWSSPAMAEPGTGESLPRASPVKGSGPRSITPSESGPGLRGESSLPPATVRERFYAEGQMPVAVGIDDHSVPTN